MTRYFPGPKLLLLWSCAVWAHDTAIAVELAAPAGDPCSQTTFAIPNGGFESGALGPWMPHYGPNNDSTITIVAPGRNSRYAVQLHANNQTGINQLQIPLCPGFQYEISVDYKVLNADDYCYLVFNAAHGNHTSYLKDRVFDLTPGDRVTTSYFYADIESDAFAVRGHLWCPESSEATVLLDNWSVRQYRAANASHCPVPIPVDNGDFESGSLAPWTTFAGTGGTAEVVTPGYQSEHAVQVTIFPDPRSVVQTSYGVAYEPFDDACIKTFNDTISLASNWLDYTGPVNATDPYSLTQLGCWALVNMLGCIFNHHYPDSAWTPATNQAGWTYHSFACIRKSHRSDLNVFVQCNPNNQGPPIASFSVLFDDITVVSESNV
jgi:hypothetical protein